MKSTKDFYTAVKERRSIYGITNQAIIPDEKIKEVIEYAVKHTPTAFNSQSGRVVILLGEHHTRLWDITKESLKKVIEADKFGPTEEKINGFRSGYGTVLFFEDMTTVESLQKQFPLYAENFSIWSQQASGILQYIVWTTLQIEGFGANLQHYNPLIDDEVKSQWKIPKEWKLIAQMPFGKISSSTDSKDYISLEERVKLFK